MSRYNLMQIKYTIYILYSQLGIYIKPEFKTNVAYSALKTELNKLTNPKLKVVMHVISSLSYRRYFEFSTLLFYYFMLLSFLNLENVWFWQFVANNIINTIWSEISSGIIFFNDSTKSIRATMYFFGYVTWFSLIIPKLIFWSQVSFNP